MKDSDIYLDAAQMVDEYEFSCNAIDIACGGYHSPQRERYERLFAPTRAPCFDSWLEYAADNGKIEFSEMCEWRVLALLFMHQIAKDEEQP